MARVSLILLAIVFVPLPSLTISNEIGNGLFTPDKPTGSSTEQTWNDEGIPTRALNIGFAHDPGQGNYDGVVGSPNDVWNFVDIGTTAVDYLRHADAGGSSARLRISRHDGEWGIASHRGIFHGYIYHNCQCVDLKVTLLDLAPARYRMHVYAHGDAPEQNANIEVIVGDRKIGSKSTVNDGTLSYQSAEFKEGRQFATFAFDVAVGQEVTIISHRDGSGYSMFNAIQLTQLAGAKVD